MEEGAVQGDKGELPHPSGGGGGPEPALPPPQHLRRISGVGLNSRGSASHTVLAGQDSINAPSPLEAGGTVWRCPGLSFPIHADQPASQGPRVKRGRRCSRDSPFSACPPSNRLATVWTVTNNRMLTLRVCQALRGCGRPEFSVVSGTARPQQPSGDTDVHKGTGTVASCAPTTKDAKRWGPGTASL